MAEAKENYLTKVEDIYRTMQRIIKSGQPVKARFEGEEEPYKTLITKVDLKGKAFAFNVLSPSRGNDLIRGGHAFELEAFVQGIDIKFRITGSLKFRSSEKEYIACLPEKVFYLQRRSAYRVPVPRTYDIYIVLRSSLNESVELKGRLIDMSASGFQAVFDNNQVDILHEVSDFDDSTLHVGDESLDLGVTARRARIDPEKGNTICGFSFQPLIGLKQRYLDKLVTQLEYEEHRKRARHAQQ